MSNESKKRRTEPVEGEVFNTCPLGHKHLVGHLEGVIHHYEEERGEVVYEDKNSSFVGGGNPVYSSNYDNMDWN